MRLIGRLLLVAGMLTMVGAGFGTGTVAAGTAEVMFPQHSCSTTIIGLFTVSANYDLDVSISADDSVEEGQGAHYTVAISGLTNGGFSRFDGGKALVKLDIGGTEVDSPTVDLAGVAQNAPIVIPDIEGSTGPLSETTDISVVQVRYWNDAASSWCNFTGDTGPSVAVLVEQGGGSGLPESTTSLSVEPTAPTYGQAATFTASVDAAGSPVSSGSVEFTDGVGASAVVLATVPVSEGSAVLPDVLLGAGSHSVVASYSGTDTVAPSQAVNTFAVSKASQTISFGELADVEVGAADIQLSATASSSLPVGFEAAGACTVAGTTLSVEGAGSCQVTASQPGDDNYLAATPVVQSFDIAETDDGGEDGDGDGDGDQGVAVQKSVTAAVAYRCVISFPSLATDLVSDQTLTVKLTAPDRATIGTTYSVYMDVAPGINTDAEIPAGAIEGMRTTIGVSAPGTPSELVTNHPTNSTTIPSGGHVVVPRSTGTVTAGGSEGDSVQITPGVILVPTKAQTPGGQGGSVTCTPAAGASISTLMTEEELTQDDSEPTAPVAPASQPPAAVGGSQSPAAPAASGAGATTGSTGSAAVQAQVIEQSAQVTFECEIYSGSNLITTQQDTQTVTVRTVDKVAPGGTLAFQMTLDPGPLTGPVALPNGVENVSVAAAIGGAASPSEVTMNVGNLTDPVGTNSNVRIPTVSGSVNVTGSPGESVTITAANMRFETARPPSRTECTAVGAPVITTTEVVEGVEVAAETAARLASTGNGREWLLPLAVAQILVGLSLVVVVRRQRLATVASTD